MTDSARPAPPYLAALTTFAIVFVLYLLTLAPTVAFWDAPEYIAAAKVLGIPHPPGNPLFTLMAHVWGLLPLAADYAKRINMFAAFCSAASAGLWFLVAERWLRSILSPIACRACSPPLPGSSLAPPHGPCGTSRS